MLEAAIRSGQAGEKKGRISLVGAGPGARDLLTLRAVRRLQEADVIVCDRRVDPEVPELARRDARRIHTGPETGASAWPEDRMDRLIVAEAKRGARVVRLVPGEPTSFAGASKEIAAARSAGVEVEIVPGVSGASASAEPPPRPFTHGEETGAFVMTRAGDLSGPACLAGTGRAT